MRENLTIAYAYGANAVSTGQARRAFEDHVTVPFRWAPIDWREHCLAGPDASQLLALNARFDRSPESGVEQRSDETLEVDGRHLVEVRAPGGVLGMADVVRAAGAAEAFASPIDLIRLVFDRRGLFRDVYRAGVVTIGTTVADMLNYLDRREAVSACVTGLLSEVIDAAPGPVVAVGESLGGVMVVDALMRMKAEGRPLGKVRLVITFGSQSAALRHIRPAGDHSGSVPFTPWLNIWHRDDFLSYPIEDTWEELGAAVRDREARHRSTFPEVHNTYLTDPRSGLFHFVNEALEGLGTS